MEAARALHLLDLARTRRRGGAPLLALAHVGGFVRGWTTRVRGPQLRPRARASSARPIFDRPGRLRRFASS
jgi:hypothetical protein